MNMDSVWTVEHAMPRDPEREKIHGEFYEHKEGGEVGWFWILSLDG